MLLVDELLDCRTFQSLNTPAELLQLHAVTLKLRLHLQVLFR